jgi:hypothetical protein
LQKKEDNIKTGGWSIMKPPKNQKKRIFYSRAMDAILVKINQELCGKAYWNRIRLAKFIDAMDWDELQEFWLKVAKPHLYLILTDRKRRGVA